MFSKSASLLALAAPLVSALTFGPVPNDLTSGGSLKLTWTTSSGDADTFTIELVNAVFNNAFALANNIDPSTLGITIALPIVPHGSGYTLEAVNVGNINDVFATSPEFSIGATVTSSTSATGSTTGTNSNSLASTASSLSGSATTAGSLSSSTGTGTSSGTSNAASTGTPSATNGGVSTTSTAAALSSRLALTSTGGYAVLLLSAVAGAVAIAL